MRLTEYAEKTGQQIAQYEEQLLEVRIIRQYAHRSGLRLTFAFLSTPHLTCKQAGTELAAEKAQFESRLRRIKLACSRWKVSYQKDVHERYQTMTNVLEERYMR